MPSWVLALPPTYWQVRPMQKAATSPRMLAWDALSRILAERRTLEEALPPMEDELRAQVRQLLMATLRHLGQIDALLKPLIDKPLAPRNRAVMDALRLGVAQLIVLNTPAHAAVNETVAMVKASKHAPLAGMVNAILKKIAGPLPDCRHNLPGWIEKRWKAQYGKAVSDTICKVAAERPPLDVNTRQPFAVGAQLDADIWRFPPQHPPVPELDGYEQGAFFVQDIAASFPVRLLKDIAGKRALDIGAAPGGKTAQLAWAGAHVTALDKSATRMQRLAQNMQRLRLDVQTVIADAMEYAPAQPFDVVVLDAPCSATGTWRRHPEVVHITTPEDIAELAATQRLILEKAWGWLKPGGTLLYCVCSLEREEGEDQRDGFLAQHADAELLAERRTTPAELADQGGMDGFFAMTLRKK